MPRAPSHTAPKSHIDCKGKSDKDLYEIEGTFRFIIPVVFEFILANVFVFIVSTVFVFFASHKI